MNRNERENGLGRESNYHKWYSEGIVPFAYEANNVLTIEKVLHENIEHLQKPISFKADAISPAQTLTRTVKVLLFNITPNADGTHFAASGIFEIKCSFVKT